MPPLADSTPVAEVLDAESPKPQVMHRAYVYVLDPTKAQEQALASHCGAARFAYNHVIGRVKANLDQRAAERSYGIADADLTPSMSWNAFAFQKDWNLVKGEVAPWWSENSARAYQHGIISAAAALKNWNDSRTGKRKGRKVEFPKFNTKRHRKSVSFPGFDKTKPLNKQPVRCEPDRHHVTLPRLGTIHTMESTRKLSRLIERGDARILRATVAFHRGRWQVSLLAELPKPPSRPLNGRVVGVDVGVKDWLVAAEADGTEVMRVPVPETAVELDKRKRKLQRRNRNRQAPDKRTNRAPSKRYLKAQRRINKVDYRIAAIREDTLHNATTELAKRYDTIVTETLNVAGMSHKGGARKRGLNRAIARSGMATTVNMLSYKVTEHVKADRWFPSSKTCSSCGAVRAKLTLGERTYVCRHTACGHTADRDTNAATNLAMLGERMTAGSPLVAARGAVHKTSDQPCAGRGAAGVEARSPKFGQRLRLETVADSLSRGA